MQDSNRQEFREGLHRNAFNIDLIVNLDILLTLLLFPKYPYT